MLLDAEQRLPPVKAIYVKVLNRWRAPASKCYRSYCDNCFQSHKCTDLIKNNYPKNHHTLFLKYIIYSKKITITIAMASHRAKKYNQSIKHKPKTDD